MIHYIIDSDIGDDITDTSAIILALKCHELGIKAILSNNNHEEDRARMLHKLVKIAGKEEDIPVFAGVKGRCKGRFTNQREFIEGYGCEVKRVKENLNYIRRLFQQKVIYISDGTLTNAAYFLEKIPEMKKNVSFHVMAGSIYKDYHGRNRAVPEWNINCDIASAQKFFSSGADITLYPLDCTWDLVVEGFSGFRNSECLLNNALYEIYRIWKRSHKREPIEFDSLLVAAVVQPGLIERWEKLKIVVDDRGRTLIDERGDEVKIALQTDRKQFLEFFNANLKLSPHE